MAGNIFGITMLVILTAIISVIVKRNSPEQAFAITLGCITVLGVYLINEFLPVVLRIQELSEQSGFEGFESILKAVGICLITQIGCDTCSDFGQTALAAKLELAGKIAILLVCMPMFENLLTIVQGLINS